MGNDLSFERFGIGIYHTDGGMVDEGVRSRAKSSIRGTWSFRLCTYRVMNAFLLRLLVPALLTLVRFSYFIYFGLLAVLQRLRRPIMQWTL